MDYGVLFQPYHIGGMEVKNRIVFSPMGTGASDASGQKSLSEIRYYEERAKGGAGMIILGNQMISAEFAHGSSEGTLDHYSAIPRLTELVEAVHRYGTKVVCQISPGTGRNEALHGDDFIPVSASPVPSAFDSNVICHELTINEIAHMMEMTARAADIAKKAGFDAIEIHAHVGYLIDQFMSEVWNHRDDKYGGSVGNRMRFPVEMIETVRGVVGDGIPIIFRIALDHRFDGGRTIEESISILKILEQNGVDAIDVDAGSYEAIDYVFPTVYLGDACTSYVCKAAKNAVDIPVMNSGNHTPETACRIIGNGDADFVMFGRQLIADPYMPKKLMYGFREDVRPCIRCNEECIGRVMDRLTKLSCSVNIRAGDEDRFRIEKTSNRKNVVVIGGGPAGMEAARIAALQGHTVTLVEKEENLGGTFRKIATPKFKHTLLELSDWYCQQLKKCGVTVIEGREMTVEDPLLEEADRIIVATGAVSIIPDIPGIHNEYVIDVTQAHSCMEILTGKRVVICGGGLSGCDFALELATEHHKDVTIIEMKSDVATDMFSVNRVSLMRKLEEAGVALRLDTRVKSIEDHAVIAETAAGEQIIPADVIVTAFGVRKNETLYQQIREKYPLKTRAAGDCAHIGKVGNAVRSGFYAAMDLDGANEIPRI